MTNPKTALDALKAAAAAGFVTIGSDTVAAQLNDEIQDIFTALYREALGTDPKRPIWTSDEGTIGGMFSGWDPETKKYPSFVYAICSKVGADLGIALAPESTWVEAALTLRSSRRKERT